MGNVVHPLVPRAIDQAQAEGCRAVGGPFGAVRELPAECPGAGDAVDRVAPSSASTTTTTISCDDTSTTSSAPKTSADASSGSAASHPTISSARHGQRRRNDSAKIRTTKYRDQTSRRPRLRRKTATNSSEVKFPKIGLAPEAMPKSRNGEVPLLENLRDRATCGLADTSGADMIDDLDGLKTNVGERGAVTRAIMMSLARTEDRIPPPR
jgi:hypothetical protein